MGRGKGGEIAGKGEKGMVAPAAFGRKLCVVEWSHVQKGSGEGRTGNLGKDRLRKSWMLRSEVEGVFVDVICLRCLGARDL